MIKTLDKFEYMSSILSIIRTTMPLDVYNDAKSTLLDELSFEDRTFFGYFIDDKLVGCCGYYIDGSQYWISWTAVFPECQHLGIGQQLLNKVLDDVRGKTNCIYVETYEHPMFIKAVNFYWKNDFKLCGLREDYLEDGSTCLYLKKHLWN